MKNSTLALILLQEGINLATIENLIVFKRDNPRINAFEYQEGGTVYSYSMTDNKTTVTSTVYSHYVTGNEIRVTSTEGEKAENDEKAKKDERKKTTLILTEGTGQNAIIVTRTDVEKEDVDTHIDSITKQSYLEYRLEGEKWISLSKEKPRIRVLKNKDGKLSAEITIASPDIVSSEDVIDHPKSKSFGDFIDAYKETEEVPITELLPIISELIQQGVEITDTKTGKNIFEDSRVAQAFPFVSKTRLPKVDARETR